MAGKQEEEQPPRGTSNVVCPDKPGLEDSRHRPIKGPGRTAARPIQQHVGTSM